MLLQIAPSFKHYASLFGVEDQSRDLRMPGRIWRFVCSGRPRMYAWCSSTTPAKPIGVWDDLLGLYLRGHLIEEVERACELLALMRALADPAARISRTRIFEFWQVFCPCSGP